VKRIFSSGKFAKLSGNVLKNAKRAQHRTINPAENITCKKDKKTYNNRLHGIVEEELPELKFGKEMECAFAYSKKA